MKEWLKRLQVGMAFMYNTIHSTGEEVPKFKHIVRAKMSNLHTKPSTTDEDRTNQLLSELLEDESFVKISNPRATKKTQFKVNPGNVRIETSGKTKISNNFLGSGDDDVIVLGLPDDILKNPPEFSMNHLAPDDIALLNAGEASASDLPLVSELDLSHLDDLFDGDAMLGDDQLGDDLLPTNFGA